MKNLFLISILWIGLSVVSNAQINIGGLPVSFSLETKTAAEEIPFVRTAVLDMESIEQEDLFEDTGFSKLGRRFGIDHIVDYGMDGSGVWSCLQDGSKLWRLGIECPDALSINLTFDQYLLPPGATLYLYSDDKSDVLGGFTSYNNQADGYFATSFVFSDRIIIEYHQPVDAEFDGVLHLWRITHGYRGPGEFLKGNSKAFGSSGSCQVNVRCESGEGWEDQIRSVFAFTSGGREICSGAIINNTANDRKPYALTANHCFEAATNPGAWVFRFNWESPTCENPATNPVFNTMSGAVLKARWPGSDFCLVELNQPIPLDFNVYYAGWSRSIEPSSLGMCIHHPSIDIKKISPSEALVAATYQGVAGWRANWSTEACTEKGSSGSPLFDINKRIVGQEYGGTSACGQPATYMFDVYGRFNLSWDGNNGPANRLKNWLDPLELNPETLDGHNCIAMESAIIEPKNGYHRGLTLTPTVILKNKLSSPLSSATISYTLDDVEMETLLWEGNIAPNDTDTVYFSDILSTYGEHAISFTITAGPDDDNLIISKSFEVIDCLPVIGLEIEQEEEYSVLSWEAPEMAIKGYRIYKEEVAIEDVPKSKNTYRDHNPEQANHHYCVTAIYDFPACTESEPSCIRLVGLSEKEADNIRVYPNPASAQITIEGADIHTVELYSITGQLLSTQKNTSSESVTLDVSSFPQGMYFIKVQTGRSRVFKVMIED